MKKMISLLLVIVLALSVALPVSAADGKVTYDGKAKSFIFAPGSDQSPTDLFPNFKGVMPGDSLTQKITVKNDADNKVKVKIYLRALGAHTDSEEFLSHLRLSVKNSAKNTMSYMFDAAASETAQLTDWVCLGTLYSGGTVDLDVTLEVPVTLDNAFQNSVGLLDWEFKVEEFPIEDTDPEPPETGDNMNLQAYFAIMLLAAVMVIALVVWRRKQENNTAQF